MLKNEKNNKFAIEYNKKALKVIENLQERESPILKLARLLRKDLGEME